MTRYTVVIDGRAGTYGVVVPDLPGCTAMGATLDEALTNAGKAMREWAELTVEAGQDLPAPRGPEEVRADPDVAAALSDDASLAVVPLVRETGRPVKTSVSLDAGVLAAIDAEAARRKLTRSAFIELLARRTLTELA